MKSRLVLTLVLLLVSCDPVSEPIEREQAAAAPTPAPTPEPSPTPAWKDLRYIPDPSVPLPREPGRLAQSLERVTWELNNSIERWRKHGDVHERAPKTVLYQAVHEQRIYRLLARNEDLYERVLPKLRPYLARSARAIVRAGSVLRSLVRPIGPDTKFLTQKPESAGNLLDYYKEAERRFDVDWEMLAAINYVETKFGRVRSPSYAGAQGPMQFLPSTWAAYGLGGEINDPQDAVMGAANYLSASGAPGDYRSALYAYNPADEYVESISLYASEIMRDPHRYFAFYNWQVFVVTTAGDLRLTGPGADR